MEQESPLKVTTPTVSITEGTPVWGAPDQSPPADWQRFFGNSNLARLNFVQTDKINLQGQALAELTERVRKLEAPIDPNDLYEAEMKRRGLAQ